MIVKCSSPTCRAREVVWIRLGSGTLASAMQALEPLGWRWRQMPGDNRPMPYCDRCSA